MPAADAVAESRTTPPRRPGRGAAERSRSSTARSSTVRSSTFSSALSSALASSWPVAFVAILVLLGLSAPNLTEGVQAARVARTWSPTSATDVALQSDPEGCGAALLATILQRGGRGVTEAELLAAAPPGPNGISLRRFQALAAQHGLHGTWRKAASGTLPRGSYVAHLDRPDGHFVWVLATAGDYLHVVDPAVGEGVWHADPFLRRFSGRYLRLGASG